jgi:hypothetical protein
MLWACRIKIGGILDDVKYSGGVALLRRIGIYEFA